MYEGCVRGMCTRDVYEGICMRGCVWGCVSKMFTRSAYEGCV